MPSSPMKSHGGSRGRAADSDKLRFTLAGCAAILRRVMDKFWSIFAMPIGVFLCFGPALLVWLGMELKAKDDDLDGQ